MTTRKILQLVRVLALGTCLVCVGTLYVWRWQPDFVQRVDGWFLRHYVQDANAALSRANDLAAEGRPDEAVRELEALVPDLRHAGRIHRLEGPRVAALSTLSDLLAEQGHLDRALEYADELYAHDDRDLLNAVRRADLLGRLGRDEESLVTIEAAARVGIRNPLIASAYLVAVARAGSADAALRAILRNDGRLIPQLTRSNWEAMVQPATGPLLRFRSPTALDESGRMRWAVPVAPDPVVAKLVRIDLPTDAPIRIEDVSVVLRMVGGHEHVLDLGNLRRSPRMERVGDVLVYRGGNDPYFVLDVPKPMRAEPVTEIEIRANVRVELSPELRARLVDEIALQDRSALVAEFGESTVLRLEEVLR